MKINKHVLIWKFWLWTFRALACFKPFQPNSPKNNSVDPDEMVQRSISSGSTLFDFTQDLSYGSPLLFFFFFFFLIFAIQSKISFSDNGLFIYIY